MKCLKEQEELRNLCSVKYEGRYPMKGMENEFHELEQVCRHLREMIQALENEKVRQVFADWQKDVMLNGPSALNVQTSMKLDGGTEPEVKFYE